MPLAKTHALDRLGRGFDLDQIVSEFRLLRHAIVEKWQTLIGPTIDAGELTKLDSAFNETIREDRRALALRAKRCADLGRESSERRPFNEAILDTGHPVHRLADDFVTVVREEAHELLSRTVRNGVQEPSETLIDGELVAFDADGRPSFNALQNFGSGGAPIVYYVFDLLILAGRDLKSEPLEVRRDLLERKVLPKLMEPVCYLGELEASLPDLIASVKAQRLEGLVAKRRDSRHEAGERSGAWQKMRVNLRP